MANSQTATAVEDGPGVAITLTGSDPQGTPLDFEIATSPTSGILSGTAPNLTYTPNSNAFGTDSFTFTVSSGGQTSAPATVSVTISAVDDNPVAVDDARTTTEGTDLVLASSGAGSPASNDTDIDGDTLSVVAVSNPTGGTVALAAGQITFEPTPNLCGPGAGGFDYTVSDGAGPTDIGHLTVDITCVNAAPVADDETATIDEDTAVVGLAVLPGDTDADGDTLDVTAVGPTSDGGTAILNPDDTIDFIPGASFQDLQVGTQRASSFSYSLSDNQGGTDTGLVTITVTGINDAPVAVDDVAATPEGTALIVPAASGALSNDTDVDAGDTLTATSFSGTLPSGAAFILNADGSYSYDPSGVAAFDELDGGESLDDTFTYTVTDSQGSTDTGLLTITVTGVNQAPVVTGATVSVAENSTNGTAVHTVAFTDPDVGQTHTFAITAGNTGGAFAIDPGTGEITVANSTALDFETTPTFSLTVAVTDDGTPPATGTATITVDLTDVNEGPIVDAATFTAADGAGPGTAVGTATFSDADAGQNHTFAITTGNTGGAFAIDPGTGEITVAVAIDFETTPTYSLTVEVTDDGTPSLSGSATITVNVTNVNEAPAITAPASISAVRDVELVVTGISVADPDAGDIELTLAVADGTLTFDSSVTGSFTSITGNGTGTVVVTATVTEINAALADPNGLTYLNDVGFAGAGDTLSLNIDDLGTPPLTASATVTIQFNQVPVAADLTLTTNEETPLGVTLSATDADDDDLTFAILTDPVNGTLSAIGPVDCTTTANICTAEVTYTPNGDFNGPDAFTYEADDGENTDNATVSITVTPVNDAPVITLSSSTPSFTEGTAGVVVDGGLTVTDIDDTNLVSGTVSITAGLVAGDTLFVTPVGGIVDSDPASGVLALSGTTTLANWQTTLQSVQFGTVNDNPTNATRTVSFTVNDGDIDSGTVTKDVAVDPVNDAPVLTQPDATPLAYTENAAPTVITPNITATDVDSTNLVGATITIGTGYASGQDVLSLGTNPQNGITAAAFNATTGTLILSGTSSGANYQAALRDVRYSNTSDDPSPATRTITFQVDDGPGPNDLSNIVSRTVTVTPVNDPPAAAAQAYTATTNMAVDIPAATGLLAGATDLEAGTTLTVGTVSATSPAGGTISSLNNATGAFRFDPPPGVTGRVTFTYTVCDNGNPGPGVCSAPATVTVTVAGPVIWFVNGSAAPGGTGRLTQPFSTIGAATTAIGANTNQRVFVYAGTYTQGITLNSGGWLVGQQVTGTNFDTVMGITPATGTIARPAIATGTAILGNTVNLQTNAAVRGITINSFGNNALTGSGGITGVDVTQTTISSVAGTTLTLNNVAGTLTFRGLTKNGAGTGISLTNVAAAVTIPTGSISNTSVAAVDIDGGTGAFSFGGPINNSAGGRTIEVTNRNTGSPGLVQFSGVITGSGTGVSLDNNDNGTISFTGGLTLSTGANPAFTAINGGTITVTDPNPPAFIPNNTITTTTGTGLTVANTNIGAAGLNFLSITSNGAPSGIVLNNTGTSGGLTVTGTGSTVQGGDNSGGTIQSTTGDGISLTNTRGASFNNMNLQNTAGHGVNGTGVTTSFSYTNGKINGAGDGSDESCISFDDLDAANVSGTFTFTNNQCTQTEANGVDIQNWGTTLSNVNISNNVFTDTGDVATPGSAVLLIGNSSASASGVVTRAALNNNTITDFRAGAGFVLQANADLAGTHPVTFGVAGSTTDIISVTGNLMDGGNGGIGNQPDRFVTGGITRSGQGNYSVSNNGTAANRIRNIDCIAIELQADGPVSVTTTVTNNFINANSAVGCAGIAIGTDDPGNIGVAGTHTTTISGNNVMGTDGPGIFAIVRDSTSSMIAKILNNTVAAPIATNAARAGIRVDSGSAEGDTTMCLEISGNTTAGSTNSATATTSPGINLRKQGTDTTINTFGIEGLTPSPTGTPNVENHVNGLNSSTSGTFGVAGTALLSAQAGFTSCTAP